MTLIIAIIVVLYVARKKLGRVKLWPYHRNYYDSISFYYDKILIDALRKPLLVQTLWTRRLMMGARRQGKTITFRRYGEWQCLKEKESKSGIYDYSTGHMLVKWYLD